MRRKLYLLPLLIAAFCGCSKKDQVEVLPEPTFDKTEFLASLSAGQKYWRCEELTVEQSGKATTFNMLENGAKLEGSTFLTLVAHTAFAFSAGGALIYLIDSGPHGNVPYATGKKLHEFIPQSAPDRGSGRWDEERQTVELRLPEIYFGAAVKSISKNKFSPQVGYIDNTLPAKYKTVEEAIAGASPDRIRLLFYEEDAVAGQIKYIFTMRAAWVTKVERMAIREHWYEVLY